MTSFSELGLLPSLLEGLAAAGYDTPTQIQADAIPALLTRRDMIGIAQTGTGKTAAFGLPILQHLQTVDAKRKSSAPRILILAPTRELATQIAQNLTKLSTGLPVRIAVVFGGVSDRPQADALRRGVDILVACPGRLLDLMGQKVCDLSNLDTVVLDEADRMLDMGFIQPIRRIMQQVPRERHTMLFSATMPTEITGLAQAYLKDPIRVEVTPAATTVAKIEQLVAHIPAQSKAALLAHLLRDQAVARAIVFTRTKHGANRVAERLEKGGIAAAAIHGNKSQAARERALAGFKEGSLRVLVATDLAARGIDVANISHVFNFDLPNEPESYVHRIGRTARAGASGIAIAFCAPDERPLLKAIEKTIRQHVPVMVVPDLPDLVPVDIERRDERSDSRQGRDFRRSGPSAPRGNNAGRDASRPAAPRDGMRAKSSAPQQQARRPAARDDGMAPAISQVAFLGQRKNAGAANQTVRGTAWPKKI